MNPLTCSLTPPLLSYIKATDGIYIPAMPIPLNKKADTMSAFFGSKLQHKDFLKPRYKLPQCANIYTERICADQAGGLCVAWKLRVEKC